VARCDGKGACGEPVERGCFPFVCGDSACKATCAGDADCAEGNRCLDGACIAVLSCEAARGVLKDLSGAVVKECGLYRCSVPMGVCLDTCASTADCVGSATCTSKGTCELAPRPAEEDGGCGCRAAGPPLPSGPGLGALAVALALGVLRRRAR
jgi:MYXO-CTERM domain-containing protein